STAGPPPAAASAGAAARANSSGGRLPRHHLHRDRDRDRRRCRPPGARNACARANRGHLPGRYLMPGLSRPLPADAFLREEPYARTRLPVSLASTLIPDAYTSPEFFQLEQERVFG